MIETPDNPQNKVISLNQINSLLRRYGLKKRRSQCMYQRSMVHRSYAADDNPNWKEANKHLKIKIAKVSNERLEFLGDGVLELVTKKYLYDRFPNEDEGFMTEKKIALVKNEHIGKLAYELGLNKWYILSKAAEDKNTRSNPKKLGCLFEAWIGAIFVDHGGGASGYAAATTFIQNVLEEHVDWQRLLTTDDNYKNILQVRIQKTFRITPDYVEIKQCREKGYQVAVMLAIGEPIYKHNLADAIPYTRFGSLQAINETAVEKPSMLVHLANGSHKVKKKAEQAASFLALQRIGFGDTN